MRFLPLRTLTQRAALLSLLPWGALIMAGNLEFNNAATGESAVSSNLTFDRVVESKHQQHMQYERKLAEARRIELDRMAAQEKINVLRGKNPNAEIPSDLLAKLNRPEESINLSAAELYTPAAHQSFVPSGAGAFYNSYENHVQHERMGIHDGSNVPVTVRPEERHSVDANYYRVTKYPEGTYGLTFNGCAVDTDGTGRDPKDRCWQGDTSVHRAADGRGLNTYTDNFVALPPAVMRSMGAKYGDHVMVIVDDGTKEGRCVYGIVGDASPMSNMRKNVAEASVHLLNEAGFNKVDGNHGIDATRFKVVVVPGSGDGKGDIARHPEQIKEALDKRTTNKTTDT